MSRTIGATPLAILAGSVIIAVAVFLGLRGRPIPMAATPLAAASSATSTAGPTSAGGLAPTAAPTGASTPNPASPTLAGLASPHDPSVEADVAAALEKQRPALVESCWKPTAGSAPNDAGAAFAIDVSFNGEGQEVAKGISPRGSPELLRCLNMRSPSLVIPSRGVRTRARVPFTLP